jgi:hypothetical protein
MVGIIAKLIEHTILPVLSEAPAANKTPTPPNDSVGRPVKSSQAKQVVSYPVFWLGTKLYPAQIRRYDLDLLKN